MKFSSENDGKLHKRKFAISSLKVPFGSTASLANSTKVPHQVKKLKAESKKKSINPVDEPKQPKINENKEEPVADQQLEPLASRDTLADLTRLTTEEISQLKLTEPKQRVERIIGFANLKFKGGQTHLVVKFEGSNQPKCVAHDEFRYEYPQELIDFYETNTQWKHFRSNECHDS